MEILYPDAKNKFSRFREDLQHLVNQPGVGEMRPCPGCTVSCSCSGSAHCSCDCSAECDSAPRMMSSEPENFLIESGIVPLVYEFYCLRSCHPCWSCEGHNDSDGNIYRLPQVWFFTTSVIYPRLIDEHIHALRHKEKLGTPWHVCLTYAPSESPYSAFALKPNMTESVKPTLESLQSDAMAIARGFSDNIRVRAEEYLAGNHF